MTYLSVLPFDNPAQAPPAWQARFAGHIHEDPETGCWEWTRSRHKRSGYGRIRYGGRPDYAHRVSLGLGYRPLTDGEQALHHCDNPPCVRHLYPGTQADNVRDREQRGRGAAGWGAVARGWGPIPAHCRNGHPLTADNIRQTRTKRLCRTCRRATEQRTYYRRVAKRAGVPL